MKYIPNKNVIVVFSYVSKETLIVVEKIVESQVAKMTSSYSIFISEE